MTQENNQNKILIGLTVNKETKSFSDWYRQTIVKSELIDYSDISGCYVLRPNAYSLWEKIQEYVNHRINKMGVRNAYFPLFVSKRALETEKSHVEGFAPEVAWVTKAGTSDLAEHIAVRPTSETIMYPHFADWIKSHRDLPLKLNQWCNVVRWEFKDCTPFIRSREFLWQEGHTCFLTKEEADIEVHQILNMYSSVYENLLAVPVIAGRKSEREKFAGGDYTTTVECYIPVVGKAVQGATSHCLGQNFSKMFGIEVEGKNGSKQFVYQNSWGITTRTIGVVTMVHGDNKGLVLPPAIAFTKVVIIPCGINSKTKKEDEDAVAKLCKYLTDYLNAADINTELDDRTNYRVGHKFNYWEMRGVPLRIEIGPKDVANGVVSVCRRDNGEKSTISCAMVKDSCDNLTINHEFIGEITNMLNRIQSDMFDKAKIERDLNVCVCDNVTTFTSALEDKHMCLVPWCENPECEDNIVANCKKLGINMKSLCIPFDQELPIKITNDTNQTIKNYNKCFYCDNKSSSYTLFGCSF
ncbi:prolyl-tRNA synthetase [Tupanvirus deep ocean]|uniref:Prolyl-tRNA synthetase n=2 Tax=Tupanvirus TaxID=2094720 RepID=A0AC62A835_9VIRU|nr:prolyl-tRNA synthetase [Tupanvirus deep ocean]QKU33788.1 prolyl-tRNA synthetase [Tupanvirus deep ocean]